MSTHAYLRVSDPSQLQGDGFTRQLSAITTFAESRNLTLTTVHEERGLTGKTEWEQRPAWLSMLNQCQPGDTILIEKLDRLARDLMVQEHIIADLRKRKITLISAAEPDLCIDDPSRKLLRQIMGAIAEYDRAMLTAKMKAAKDRMKAEGKRCEGRKPFGHAAGEEFTLGRMRELRASGLTFERIASKLNEDKVPAKLGSNWSTGSVHKILSRAA